MQNIESGKRDLVHIEEYLYAVHSGFCLLHSVFHLQKKS